MLPAEKLASMPNGQGAVKLGIMSASPPQIIEGTGEELQQHLKQPKGSGLRRGMFPQLRGLTEEDFKAAEWHGKNPNL